MRGGAVNDVLPVPDDVWDAEKNYTESHPDVRQTGTSPSNACVSIKVVYNDGWINTAGRGNKALAQKMALDVLKGAQDIYNTKFAGNPYFSVEGNTQRDSHSGTIAHLCYETCYFQLEFSHY